MNLHPHRKPRTTLARRVALLEAQNRLMATELAIVNGELETHRLLIDLQAPSADPQRVVADAMDTLVASVRACDDDDLPPGITSVTELISMDEHRAAYRELWGQPATPDAPTVAFTKAEEAAWAEQISECADGGQS